MALYAADGEVRSSVVVSDSSNGFPGGLLDLGDRFGRSVTNIGDLNGDDVPDLAVGAWFDDDGGADQFAERGAVWILFMQKDGTVDSVQKISDTAGGLSGDGNPGGLLADVDLFGVAVAWLGDLGGTAPTPRALAVGTGGDNDGDGNNSGAVWILFLNTDGTVARTQKISETSGGFTGILDPDDNFGFSLANLGDLNGDGTPGRGVASLPRF
jgi:hypothetical protein